MDDSCPTHYLAHSDARWNGFWTLILTIFRAAVMVTMMVLRPHGVHIWDWSDRHNSRKGEVIGGVASTEISGEALSSVRCVIHHVEVTHLIFTGGPVGVVKYSLHVTENWCRFKLA